MLNVRDAQIFASAICEPPATEFATQLLEIKCSLSLISRIRKLTTTDARDEEDNAQ